MLPSIRNRGQALEQIFENNLAHHVHRERRIERARVSFQLAIDDLVWREVRADLDRLSRGVDGAARVSAAEEKEQRR